MIIRNIVRASKRYGLLAFCVGLLQLSAQSSNAQCPKPIVSEIEVRNPNCHGATQGSVTGRISGGTPPYSIALSGRRNARVTISLEGGSYLFGGLIEGDYNITITDANADNNSGCSASESFSIMTPPELTLETTTESASCSNETGGKLRGLVTGGTPPYSFLLNGAPITPGKISNTSSGLSFEINGLKAGAYFLRVTDNNYSSSGNAAGCTVAETVAITSSSSGNIVETELDAEICEGQSYQFGTKTLTKSGTYEETFTAASGCDSVVNLHLTVKAAIETSVEAEICEGQDYQLGTKILSERGIYRETFTTDAGCDSIVVLNLKIKEGNAFEVNTSPTVQTICADDTVPISVEIDGGTADFQIRWYDNPETSGDPIGSDEMILVDPRLGENVYYVEVTDAEGCTSVGMSTLIFRPIDATIDPIESDICEAAEETAISISNHDPNQQLSFEWNPANAILSDPSQAEVLVDVSMATEFSVKVSNEEGCEETFTSSFTNDSCEAFEIVATRSVVTPGGSAVLTVSGCEDCRLLWSTGETDSTITVTPMASTTYSVSITTEAGCACKPLEQTVGVNDCVIDPDDFFVPTAFTPNGDLVNDELCVRSELELVPDDAVDILLIIYNRWGQELFRGTSFGDCWDGTFRGAAVAPDVYGYHLTVSCPDADYTKKGDVTILR